MRTRLKFLLPILLVASSLRADRIVLHNGQTVTGTITAEDSTSVTLRSAESTASLALTRKVAKSTIKEISRPVRQGPAYVTLPIHGVIGEEVTPAAVRSALAEAHAADVKYILLDIDSPGGSIGDLVQILDALAASAANGHEIVAHVKTAYSCAAILAMACEHVYMVPNSTLGAAVPYRATPGGPAEIDAKLRSAVGAKFRSYVTAAGHDGLLVNAMMETDVAVYLDDSDPAKPKLSAQPPGRLIKEKGTILTLTAKEAVECGLATVAADATAVAAHLVKGPWHEPTRRPYEVMTAGSADLRDGSRASAESRKVILGPATRSGSAASARVKAQYNALAKQIGDLDDKAAANAKAMLALRRSTESEAAVIRDEYDAACARARTQADLAGAKQKRDARLAALRRQVEPAVVRLAEESDKLRLRLFALRTEQKTLLANLPLE